MISGIWIDFSTIWVDDSDCPMRLHLFQLRLGVSFGSCGACKSRISHCCQHFVFHGASRRSSCSGHPCSQTRLFSSLLIFKVLLLAHLLLRIGTNELFDDHVAAANTNYQSSIENFCENLTRSKHVKAVSKALYRHRTASFVDVVAEEFVEHVTLLACENLHWPLLFALLCNGFLQRLNLQFAPLQLSICLAQIFFSLLHQRIQLIYMFRQNFSLILHMGQITLASANLRVQVANVRVKSVQLQLLLPLILSEPAYFTSFPDLIFKGPCSVISRV